VEIEIKLALAEREVARFKRHPLLKGLKPERRRLYSLYFDSPDWELQRRRVALRLRRVGYHWVQTVKAEAETTGALTRRPEWEVQVTGNRPDLAVLPEEARDLIPTGSEQRLAPAFETEFTRTAWQLHRGGGEIEVALDQGAIRAGDQAWPISEVEMELKSGEVGALFDLADAFLADLPFQLEPRSKAYRGYQLAGCLDLAPVKASVPAIEAATPAHAAYADLAQACLAQFGANLPGLLTGDDVEFLHQMRIAMRRLRALAGLVRFIGLPRPTWVEELRWLMGELSPARDWDVFVTETLSRIGPALPERTALDALAEPAGRFRSGARERARQAVSSTRLVRLWLAIEGDLASLPPSGQDTAGWAVAALDRRYRQLRRAGRHVGRLDAAGRHALRIASKKQRYAGEFFAGLHPKRSRAFLTALAGLQDLLGVLNDAVVTSRLLMQIKEGEGRAALEPAGMVTGFLACEAGGRLGELAGDWKVFRKIRRYWRKGGRSS
jgi:inorganic triphosphatase YgiF